MKYSYIDSIRGIAILLVILVHVSQHFQNLNQFLKPLLAYGQMGVQLFFVASAFTLCLSSENRIEENNKFFKFGIRRIFRIAPAYYLGILLYFFINVFLNFFIEGEIKVDEKYNFLNIFLNVFFLHGFYLPANNSIVPGGWSIATEMSFYFIFPFINIFFRKYFESSVFKIFFGFILSLIFSTVCLFILENLNFDVHGDIFFYFNIINQLPVFIIGICYFYLTKIKSIEFSVGINLLLFLFFTLLALSFSSYENNKVFFILYKINLLPIFSGLSFVFLIELFKKCEKLNCNILIKIGKVSYSMYLIHFVFADNITSLFVSKFKLVNSFYLILFYFVSVFLTFLISIFTQKIIENKGVLLGNYLINKLDK